ncbi:TrbC/VirB2 family protein [Erythrobacter ani]|uniref:TrbC/VirB2 family protein n=1 Tax=Erythrobacter ani TaxID=2827235 RepID=A0ABS6SMJ4_9SPHN|nr:TrbC/VirB2 family protein [Erythrobacter ani]MBV7266263.1 TrbC/VirB2 family protein [Erythrobacter ani]
MGPPIQPSLFEPAGGSQIDSSMTWINGVLLGEIAIGLCALSVAFVGALMLAGRLPLQRGMRIVVGCFVLLGAPAIASGFMWSGTSQAQPAPPPSVDQAAPRTELPPADYDPYAGASLRRD